MVPSLPVRAVYRIPDDVVRSLHDSRGGGTGLKLTTATVEVTETISLVKTAYYEIILKCFHVF